MAAKALFSLFLLSCIFVGACGPNAEDIARAEAQAQAEADSVAAAQATPDPLPTCDEARASGASRSEAITALNKESDKLDWQSKNLAAESNQLLSDYQAGRITKDEFQPKAVDMKARAKALKTRVTAIQTLQQCLKSENPSP